MVPVVILNASVVILNASAVILNASVVILTLNEVKGKNLPRDRECPE